MLFKTMGEKENPAVLFFHAMGVTGASSERVARFMSENLQIPLHYAHIHRLLRRPKIYRKGRRGAAD